MSTEHDDHDDNGEEGIAAHPFFNDPGSEDPGSMVEELFPERHVDEPLEKPPTKP